MRNIKFRAWDGSKLHYNVVVSGSEIIEVNPLAGFRLRTVKDIQQYTGLKDKNGKEVYEGDRLKFHERWDRYDDFVGEVFWHKQEARWVHTFEDGRPSKAFWGTDWEYEVIGNIYEDMS